MDSTMIKLYQRFHRIRKVNLTGPALFLFLVTLSASGALHAQDQQAESGSEEISRVAQSMAKTMDPNTYFLMMTMAMDPRIWANPISSCAACHDNEDVGRYQQVFGPYMAAMMNPMTMASPDAYNNMMASILDPKTSENWLRAIEEKYGLNPGDPLPGMHTLPWGMVPGAPTPYPAQ
jgi:hypothetical protein